MSVKVPPTSTAIEQGHTGAEVDTVPSLGEPLGRGIFQVWQMCFILD